MTRLRPAVAGLRRRYREARIIFGEIQVLMNSKALNKTLRRSSRALQPAQFPDLAGQGGVLLVEVLARLRSSCVRLLLVGVGNVRLEDLPPAVVQLRPFFSAERGAGFRDVPVCDQRVFQLLGVASYDGAEEIEDALLDDGVIAREVLHGHVGLLRRERIEKHRGSERRIRSGLFVDDGEERGEAVGGVLLHAGQRKCEVVDEGVAKLVAEDELVGPDVQRVGREVLCPDRLRDALVADHIGDELHEEAAGRVRPPGRPEDRPAVHFRCGIVEGNVVADFDHEIVWQGERLGRTVSQPIEHARVPDLLHDVPVLGLNASIVVHDLHPTGAACHGGLRVMVVGAGCELQKGCDKDDGKDVLSHVGQAFTRMRR